MSYNDKIIQTEVLPYAELYVFKIGNEYVRLTSYVKDIDCSLGEFKRAIIKKSIIKTSSRVENSSDISISIYVGENVSKDFIQELLHSVSVRIYRYFIDTGDHKLIFVGYGESVGVGFDFITLKLSSILGVKNKEVPNIFYQVQCNNTLFDKRCKLSPANFMINIPAGGLTKVSDVEYKSSLIAIKPDDYFLNGVIEVGSDFRMIVYHKGDTIKLHFKFDYEIINKSCNLYAGCNKTIEDCRNKFNNERNFLGFRRIPYTNPVIYGIQ